jgi:hypothetical protein
MSSFCFRSGIFFSVIVFFVLPAENISAQNKYWVSFTDKAGVSFNPYEYFSQRTIERRARYGIPLNDSSDFPVNEDYIRQVKNFSDSVGWASRWLNGITVFASEEEIKQLSELPFVADVEKLSAVSELAQKNSDEVTASALKPQATGIA